MKKSWKRLLAMLLAASLAFGDAAPVFAAEIAQKTEEISAGEVAEENGDAASMEDALLENEAVEENGDAASIEDALPEADSDEENAENEPVKNETEETMEESGQTEVIPEEVQEALDADEGSLVEAREYPWEGIYEPMTLDQEYNHDFSEGYLEKEYYFVPEESGVYYVNSTYPEMNVSYYTLVFHSSTGSYYDSDAEKGYVFTGEGLEHAQSCMMEAGKIYRISVHAYAYNEEDSCTYNLQYAGENQTKELEIDGDEDVLSAGEQAVYRVTPPNAGFFILTLEGECETEIKFNWSGSKSDGSTKTFLLEPNIWDENYVLVEAKGETRVRVETLPLMPLTLGEAVTVAANEIVGFEYVTEENGTYYVNFPDGSFNGRWLDEDGQVRGYSSSCFYDSDGRFWEVYQKDDYVKKLILAGESTAEGQILIQSEYPGTTTELTIWSGHLTLEPGEKKTFHYQGKHYGDYLLQLPDDEIVQNLISANEEIRAYGEEKIDGITYQLYSSGRSYNQKYSENSDMIFTLENYGTEEKIVNLYTDADFDRKSVKAGETIEFTGDKKLYGDSFEWISFTPEETGIYQFEGLWPEWLYQDQDPDNQMYVDRRLVPLTEGNTYIIKAMWYEWYQEEPQITMISNRVVKGNGVKFSQDMNYAWLTVTQSGTYGSECPFELWNEEEKTWEYYSNNKKVELASGKSYAIACYYDSMFGVKNQVTVLDYDYYEAFIASGGYVSVDAFGNLDIRQGSADWLLESQVFTIFGNWLYDVLFKEENYVKQVSTYWQSEEGWFVPYDCYDLQGNDISQKTMESGDVVLAKFVPEIVWVDSMEVKGEKEHLEVGETAQILIDAAPATSKYPFRSEPEYSYLSSDPEVVSVDENGVMTAQKAGVALISVAADETLRWRNGQEDQILQKSFTVTVGDGLANVTVLDYDYYEAFVASGGSVSLDASGKLSIDQGTADWTLQSELLHLYDSYTYGDIPKWQMDKVNTYWKSSEGAFSPVQFTDLKGVDVSKETAVDNAVVLVKYEPEIVWLDSIRMEAEKDVLKIDETTQITATPCGATEKYPLKKIPEVRFESENENIASVDQTGKVTAHAAGEVKIYAYATDPTDSKKEISASVLLRIGENPNAYQVSEGTDEQGQSYLRIDNETYDDYTAFEAAVVVELQSKTETYDIVEISYPYYDVSNWSDYVSKEVWNTAMDRLNVPKQGEESCLRFNRQNSSISGNMNWNIPNPVKVNEAIALNVEYNAKTHTLSTHEINFPDGVSAFWNLCTAEECQSFIDTFGDRKEEIPLELRKGDSSVDEVTAWYSVYTNGTEGEPEYEKGVNIFAVDVAALEANMEYTLHPKVYKGRVESWEDDNGGITTSLNINAGEAGKDYLTDDEVKKILGFNEGSKFDTVCIEQGGAEDRISEDVFNTALGFLNENTAWRTLIFAFWKEEDKERIEWHVVNPIELTEDQSVSAIYNITEGNAPTISVGSNELQGEIIELIIGHEHSSEKAEKTRTYFGDQDKSIEIPGTEVEGYYFINDWGVLMNIQNANTLMPGQFYEINDKVYLGDVDDEGRTLYIDPWRADKNGEPFTEQEIQTILGYHAEQQHEFNRITICYPDYLVSKEIWNTAVDLLKDGEDQQIEFRFIEGKKYDVNWYFYRPEKETSDINLWAELEFDASGNVRTKISQIKFRAENVNLSWWSDSYKEEYEELPSQLETGAKTIVYAHDNSIAANVASGIYAYKDNDYSSWDISIDGIQSLKGTECILQDYIGRVNEWFLDDGVSDFTLEINQWDIGHSIESDELVTILNAHKEKKQKYNEISITKSEDETTVSAVAWDAMKDLLTEDGRIRVRLENEKDGKQWSFSGVQDAGTEYGTEILFDFSLIPDKVSDEDTLGMVFGNTVFPADRTDFYYHVDANWNESGKAWIAQLQKYFPNTDRFYELYTIESPDNEESIIEDSIFEVEAYIEDNEEDISGNIIISGIDIDRLQSGETYYLKTAEYRPTIRFWEDGDSWISFDHEEFFRYGLEFTEETFMRILDDNLSEGQAYNHVELYLPNDTAVISAQIWNKLLEYLVEDSTAELVILVGSESNFDLTWHFYEPKPVDSEEPISLSAKTVVQENGIQIRFDQTEYEAKGIFTELFSYFGKVDSYPVFPNYAGEKLSITDDEGNLISGVQVSKNSYEDTDINDAYVNIFINGIQKLEKNVNYQIIPYIGDIEADEHIKLESFDETLTVPAGQTITVTYEGPHLGDYFIEQVAGVGFANVTVGEGLEQNLCNKYVGDEQKEVYSYEINRYDENITDMASFTFMLTNNGRDDLDVKVWNSTSNISGEIESDVVLPAPDIVSLTRNEWVGYYRFRPTETTFYRHSNIAWILCEKPEGNVRVDKYRAQDGSIILERDKSYIIKISSEEINMDPLMKYSFEMEAGTSFSYTEPEQDKKVRVFLTQVSGDYYSQNNNVRIWQKNQDVDQWEYVIPNDDLSYPLVKDMKYMVFFNDVDTLGLKKQITILDYDYYQALIQSGGSVTVDGRNVKINPGKDNFSFLEKLLSMIGISYYRVEDKAKFIEGNQYWKSDDAGTFAASQYYKIAGNGEEQKLVPCEESQVQDGDVVVIKYEPEIVWVDSMSLSAESTVLKVDETTIISVETKSATEKYGFVDTPEIRFESSNPEIADVDENGVVTAYSEGEVTITVYADETLRRQEGLDDQIVSESMTFTVIKEDEQEFAFTYEILDDGTAKIVGYEGIANGDLIIPSEISGYKVTVIDNGAFWECVNVTSVSIPEGVVSIGLATFFGCNNLKKVTFPSTLESIGNAAFRLCESLTEVELPERLTYLGSFAFAECSKLEKINIPKGITSINNATFQKCSFTEIELPSGVSFIELHAFSDCSKLEKINIPDSVTEIDRFAFFNCISLQKIELPDSVNTIRENAFVQGDLDTEEYENLDITIRCAKYSYPYEWAVENNFQVECTNCFKVQLNANGGTINSGNITEYLVGRATKLPTDVTKDGYTFAGWYENDECSGAAVTEISAGSTGDKTFYVKWTAVEYSITYNVNGGELPKNAAKAYTIESKLLTLVTPSRDGYTFSGWYENEDFSGTAVTEIPAGSTGDKTFYAKWTAVEYSIVYNVNGGKLPENVTEVYTKASETITLVTPERTGYTFDGWYTRASFGSKYKVTEIPTGSTGEKIFYAKWILDTYEIAYKTDGGTFEDAYPISYDYESTVTLPNPVRMGYEFEGWFNNPEFENSAVTKIEAGTLAENLTFYAKWKWNVTFEAALNEELLNVVKDENGNKTIILPYDVDSKSYDSVNVNVLLSAKQNGAPIGIHIPADDIVIELYRTQDTEPYKTFSGYDFVITEDEAGDDTYTAVVKFDYDHVEEIIELNNIAFKVARGKQPLPINTDVSWKGISNLETGATFESIKDAVITELLKETAIKDIPDYNAGTVTFKNVKNESSVIKSGNYTVVYEVAENSQYFEKAEATVQITYNTFSQAGVTYVALDSDEVDKDGRIVDAAAIAAPIESESGVINTTPYVSGVKIIPVFHTPWGELDAFELETYGYDVKVTANIVSGLSIAPTKDGNAVEVNASAVPKKTESKTIKLTSMITLASDVDSESTDQPKVTIITTINNFKVFNGGSNAMKNIECSLNEDDGVMKIENEGIKSYILEKNDVKRTHTLNVTTTDYAGNEFAYGDGSLKDKLTWTTSNKNVASVSVDSKTGIPTLSVPKNAQGVAEITATAKDAGKYSVSFRIVVADTDVRVETTKLTLNSKASEGTWEDSTQDQGEWGIIYLYPNIMAMDMYGDSESEPEVKVVLTDKEGVELDEADTIFELDDEKVASEGKLLIRFKEVQASKKNYTVYLKVTQKFSEEVSFSKDKIKVTISDQCSVPAISGKTSVNYNTALGEGYGYAEVLLTAAGTLSDLTLAAGSPFRIIDGPEFVETTKSGGQYRVKLAFKDDLTEEQLADYIPKPNKTKKVNVKFEAAYEGYRVEALTGNISVTLTNIRPDFKLSTEQFKNPIFYKDQDMDLKQMRVYIDVPEGMTLDGTSIKLTESAKKYFEIVGNPEYIADKSQIAVTVKSLTNSNASIQFAITNENFYSGETQSKTLKTSGRSLTSESITLYDRITDKKAANSFTFYQSQLGKESINLYADSQYLAEILKINTNGNAKIEVQAADSAATKLLNKQALIIKEDGNDGICITATKDAFSNKSTSCKLKIFMSVSDGENTKNTKSQTITITFNPKAYDPSVTLKSSGSLNAADAKAKVQVKPTMKYLPAGCRIENVRFTSSADAKNFVIFKGMLDGSVTMEELLLREGGAFYISPADGAKIPSGKNTIGIAYDIRTVSGELITVNTSVAVNVVQTAKIKTSTSTVTLYNSVMGEDYGKSIVFTESVVNAPITVEILNQEELRKAGISIKNDDGAPNEEVQYKVYVDNTLSRGQEKTYIVKTKVILHNSATKKGEPITYNVNFKVKLVK